MCIYDGGKRWLHAGGGWRAVRLAASLPTNYSPTIVKQRVSSDFFLFYTFRWRYRGLAASAVGERARCSSSSSVAWFALIGQANMESPA